MTLMQCQSEQSSNRLEKISPESFRIFFAQGSTVTVYRAESRAAPLGLIIFYSKLPRILSWADIGIPLWAVGVGFNIISSHARFLGSLALAFQNRFDDFASVGRGDEAGG